MPAPLVTLGVTLATNSVIIQQHVVSVVLLRINDVNEVKEREIYTIFKMQFKFSPINACKESINRKQFNGKVILI